MKADAEMHLKPRHTLEELLAQCDIELTKNAGAAGDSDAPSEEDDTWIELRPVGREL